MQKLAMVRPCLSVDTCRGPNASGLRWPRCIKEAVSLTLGYVGSVNVDLMSGWVILKSLGFTSVRFSAEYLVLKAIF
ncbi:hypothetical protein SUGI_0092430 [Cryptomeria japonica]|nr:hypothetical protein SUGI_0092430 [Cryptomeria japonica]